MSQLAKNLSVSKFQVVIIDDEKDIVEVLCGKIKENPLCEVIGFHSSTDAVEYLTSNQPDFIITDIRMPVFDGYDLSNISELVSPEVPVVAFTGFSPDNVEGLSGFDAIIQKPNQGILIELLELYLKEISF